MFIKLENDIFEVLDINETWCVKIYDYPEKYLRKYSDGKYHKVYADNKDKALEILHVSYADYKKGTICVDFIDVKLKNIIQNTTNKRKIESKEKLDELINNKNFTANDLNLIMKYKELQQKERHHKELIKTKLKIGRALEKTGRIQAGLPMDLC